MPEPLRLRQNNVVVASVDGQIESAEADMPFALKIDMSDAAAANDLVAAFGVEENLAGSALIQVDGTLGDDGPTATASIGLVNFRTSNATIDGALQLRIDPDSIRFTESPPLVVNNGRLDLADVRYDLETGVLHVPEGELASEIGLNPQLADLFGQFVNPLLVDPQNANGFLFINVDRPASIRTDAPLASQVAMAFSVNELKVTNDIVAELADQLVRQVEDEIVRVAGPAGRIPGFDLRATARSQLGLDRLTVGTAIRDEIGTFGGTIRDSSLRLDNGIVQSSLTFDLIDPRQGRSETYALTFAGGVNAETKAMDVRADVPLNLLEKWFGQNPPELVKLFGDRPLRTLLPNGVSLSLGGTTRQPTIDATGTIETVAPRLVEALLKNAGGDPADAVRDGLRKLEGLFN